MKKKIYITLGILIALAVIGYFTFPSIRPGSNGDANTIYQTEPARKGSVSVSVGDTGIVQSNQTAFLAWQTNGKVATVNTQKGMYVEEGTVLAELKSTSLSQNVLQAQVDLINAQSELDKAINNSEARADAHLAVINAQQALDDANKEAQSKLYQRASQETIDIARANLIEANEALDKAEKKWDQTKNADADSLIYAAGLSQYAAARQEQQRAEYNLRYVKELPDALTVEEANIEVEQAEAQLLTAKQNWEKVKDGPDPDKVLAAQVRMDIAQATLDQASITAPFAGTITRVDSKVGDLVNAGTQAFQIDDLSRLLVDVDISEMDISQVKIGQTVILTFDAIQDEKFDGVVTDIALTSSGVGGSANFTVTVEILDPSSHILPGMTAAVEITVNQLDDILLVPSRAVRAENDARVVYVLKNNQPVAVEITLGVSADNYSQVITGDLKAGDLIILNPPTTQDLQNMRNSMGTTFGGG
ncbi:MAG: efflux RND transporter periplasmic adaptor subunit [Chloroflexi bacterium]|nr:efflux RND transporter periplasmic adaptor subunit [Chloroflexota bacterium]